MQHHLKVSRVLHAGYIFEYNNTKILFDPIFENPFSVNCYAFPPVEFEVDKIRNENFSAVFISHFHDDHCSLKSLDLLNRDIPIYMFCVHPEMFELIKSLGFKKVISLDINSLVKVGEFKITPRRSLDVDVDSIFQINVANLKVLNVVDSWIDPETFELLLEEGPWDLVLWPFQTMRELEVLSPSRAGLSDQDLPQEWKEQIRFLNARCFVPSSCQFKMESWSWYNKAFFPVTYKKFKEVVNTVSPQSWVWRLDPSHSLILTESEVIQGAALPWIKNQSSDVLDYEYEPTQKPMSTAEIAQKLTPPSQSEVNRVLSFLDREISELYKSLTVFDEGYFRVPRIWELRVYDQFGQHLVYRYSVHGDQMERAPSNTEEFHWLTEIPLIKIYGALENGESLTSIYMRINDGLFVDDIEAELQQADLFEDPLVRCLYEGQFASYQKAQLKNLRNKNI